jgi:hypothetical protein
MAKPNEKEVVNPATKSDEPIVSAYAKPEKFPYTNEDAARINDYVFYRQLLDGAHFEAFRQRVKSEDFNKAYAQIRYVYVNFAGMISRVVSDMLFGEGVKIKLEGDKAHQAWLEDFWRQNYLSILFYESALTNSAKGDECFKLRVGKRQPIDRESSIIVESTPPNIYFPHVDPFNVAGEPAIKELAWLFMVDKNQYLRREIHEAGRITNEVWRMKGDRLETQVDPKILNIPGLANIQATGIDEHMIIHVPNWKTTDRHFGYSDYYDLDSIFYAINNRISMVDNVLDKHTDPILMVPPGVIDKKTGKVKRDGRVIEMGKDSNGKPEYIVWDASLENAFKQIDKLVEFMFMVGEVSPDVLGMGQGQSDSGRALKFKLLRTLAKVNRKKIYYDRAIKQVLLVAQKLAKAWGIKVNGKAFTWEPIVPELTWQDGIPADETEIIDNTTKALDAGITSQKDAIMQLHGVDEDTADKIIKQINDENKLNMQNTLDPARNPFNKPKPGDPKNPPPKPPTPPVK